MVGPNLTYNYIKLCGTPTTQSLVLTENCCGSLVLQPQDIQQVGAYYL